MRKLTIFSAAFAVGAAGYIWLFSPAVGLIFAALLLLGTGCLRLWRSDKGKRLRIFALGAAMGLFWSWGYEQLYILPQTALAGEDREIQARVCELPQETDYGCRVVCKIQKGRILLYLDCTPEEISLSDTLRLRADILDVSKGMGDNENLYYQSKDISLMGIQRGKLEIQKAEKLSLWDYPILVADALRNSLRESFPEDTEGFARALVLGDRDGLSYEMENDFSITGVIHVVSVSGMHISLLIGIILWLFRGNKRLAAVFCMLVGLFFAAMLGFIPSVSRAVIMNCVLLFAPIFKRENDSLTSLSLALLVILAFNPWAIANLSLQLSFASMVGIFLLAPFFYQKMAEFFKLDELREKNSLWAKPIYSGLAILSTTFGAIIATTPLVAASFGTVSLISPLTNLLTMGAISFSFSGSFLTGIAGLIWSPLGKALGWIIAWPMRFALWVVDCLAEIPYAAVYTDSVYIVAWLVAAYVLIAIYLWKGKNCKGRTFLTCLAVTLLAAVLFSGLETPSMSVTAMDVGQGQCIVVQSGGKTALIDCGGDRGDANGEEVSRKLLMSGETRVDALILTHFDEDHMCGLPQLMKRLEVATLYVPDVQEGEKSRALVLQAAQEEGAEVVFIDLETQITFGTGEISLYPPTDLEAENASLSALLSFGEYDILVTGDMTSHLERKLLKEYEFPDIELLFVGHHGSKYSTCTELLETVRPETAIICVGENSYGHPTKEVLERLALIGAEVYRTDLHGDITIQR